MYKNKMKAVIPVAGLGTRMLPATKAIPKEMLMIVDKPLIQYLVEEAISAGIKDIVLVTNSCKSAIENHLVINHELISKLVDAGKDDLADQIRSIVPNDVNIISVRQSEPAGLGHAILCAKPVVGDNDFVVMLPDVLINKYQCNLSTDNLSKMINNFYDDGSAQILVEPVPRENVGSYGIIDLFKENLWSGKTSLIKNIIEKPSIENAPTNLAVVGRYVLPALTWKLLENVEAGACGEIQLTDALDGLIECDFPVSAYSIVGNSYDCGSKLGYARAFIDYANCHPEICGDLISN